MKFEIVESLLMNYIKEMISHNEEELLRKVQASSVKEIPLRHLNSSIFII